MGELQPKKQHFATRQVSKIVLLLPFSAQAESRFTLGVDHRRVLLDCGYLPVKLPDNHIGPPNPRKKRALTSVLLLTRVGRALSGLPHLKPESAAGDR